MDHALEAVKLNESNTSNSTDAVGLEAVKLNESNKSNVPDNLPKPCSEDDRNEPWPNYYYKAVFQKHGWVQLQGSMNEETCRLDEGEWNVSARPYRLITWVKSDDYILDGYCGNGPPNNDCVVERC